jgi:non-specific serine/threonine protein kinase/serine/threonine-protein kinase
MTPEKWKQIKAIFDEAVELSSTGRERRLASVSETEISDEVRKMLATDAVDLFEFSPVKELLNNVGEKELPEKIGVYKIVKEIGRGGMGAVFLAERADGEFSQQVAIKLIKRGMDSDEILRRFRNERQILAELHHPYIARLLDGGVSADGSPFYAMEYVEGFPIDVYSSQNNLDVIEKLELFRKICAAVSYAHSQLVVHRDLKPSNILVTENGTPKLLDFGIAKILRSSNSLETATQKMLMTPEYASPEQIRGEKVTTASDVYSLGVILYELLTDEKPFPVTGRNYAEIIQIVCESVPLKPSHTQKSKVSARNAKSTDKPQNNKKEIEKSKLLRGDLDNIVLKALQKDASRRYQSVEKLSEDIRRHLVGLPVTARADSSFYRAGKFIKRNKISVAAASLIFLSLCVGMSVAVWQAHRAERQKVLAEKRFAEVRRLANAVVFKYHDAIAELQGSTAAREMLVKDAAQYLDALAEESSEDVDLQIELALAYLKLGDVQGKMYAANIGDTKGALVSYRKSVELLESVLKIKPTDADAVKESLIKAYESLAFLMLRSGDSRGAQELVVKALKLHSELPESVEREMQLVELYIRLGDVNSDIKEEYLRLNNHLKALTLAEKIWQADPNSFEKTKTLARVYQRVGTDYVVNGKRIEENGGSDSARELFVKAMDFHSKSLEAAEKMMQIEPENASSRRYLTSAYHNLAESLALNGKYDEALRLAKMNYDLIEAMLRSDIKNKEAKFSLSLANQLFADIYSRKNDFDKFFEFAERSLQMDEELYQNDPVNVEVRQRIISRNKELANLYEKKGDLQKANLHRRRAENVLALFKSSGEK